METDRARKSGRRFATAIVLAMALACISLPGLAHTPLLYIEDNGDGTMYVEGAFSDGSSGAGLPLRLEAADGEVLWEGILGDFGAIEAVPIPDISPYYVVFEGGPGHTVTKEGITPSAAAEPEETVPTASVSAASAPPETSQPATSSPASSPPAGAVATTPQPGAWSPAATLSPEWYSAAASVSSGSDGTCCPALWVIVGLLSFIAFQLIILGIVAAFLAGWKLGGRHPRRTE
jgi:hypothetical protein